MEIPYKYSKNRHFISMEMGDQMILEEDFDENYEPTEEGLLLVVHLLLFYDF